MQSYRIASVLLPASLACSTGAMAAADLRDANTPATSASFEDPATEPPASSNASNMPAPDHKWHFSTIGYVFAAGAYGKTTPRSPLPPVDLSLSFGDVLKAFKFALMGAAEVRKDRLVFMGDLMWVHLGESKGLSIRDSNFADVKIDSKTTAITALAGYRVVNKGPIILDLLAGTQLNGNKQEVEYSGTVVDATASLSKIWFDPIVATRISAPLASKTNLSLYGDIGGFGIGSHLTWQGIATVNYQISRKMNAGLGWRYFKINYKDNDGFLYDVAQSGPIVTLRTDF